MEQTMTTERVALWHGWRVAVGLLAMLALLALGLWNLAGPPMWWDEGWTLSVARTWVERGHYGRLLDGQLAAGGLQAALPVTGSVALSFKLFGVGVWQGRLPGVVVMVAALALMYVLAERLYNRRVAIGTLFVLLCMSMHPQLHPLIMGRQVIGEMYMFCFLLAGYICLLLALRRSPWWMALAAIGWGLALNTKAQMLPFWLVALVAPLAVALVLRRFREAALLGVGLIGSYGVAWYVLPLLTGFIVRDRQAGQIISLGTVQGLYDVTAWAPNSFNRWFAVQIMLITGLPTLGGLCYGLWHALHRLSRRELPVADAGFDTVRLSLLALAGSWFAWFVLLSVGVPRYLYPATFVGSIFVAALLNDLTNHFSLQSTLNRATTILKGKLNRQVASAWLAIALLALTVPITLLTLNNYYLSYTDTSAIDVANFLNSQTPPNALIETYESEVHFLLERRYHYPPDQIHVELNRRSLLHQNVTIDYDPLAANPDYLLVGRFAREDALYQPLIDSGAFRLLRSYGGYLLYERVR
jgi:4-amino-4-deoxy-L-arabinose transferase-like glycosyltransferase